MALTQTNINLIDAVANGDMHKAKNLALASIREDKTKKNEWVAKRYEKLLRGAAYNALDAIPASVRAFLKGYTPSSFHEDRYYLTEENKEIFENIYKMRMVSDLMTEREIDYPNTTLLYGEPGCGKTELARFVAYRLKMPFFYINFADTINSYLGETAKNIHNAFRYIEDTPCVFMIDEIDCIGMQRKGGRDASAELERTTISIMQAIDSLPNNVTLIGATNRLDVIDKALLDRFSQKHEIHNLPKEQLRELAQKFIDATASADYISTGRVDEIAEFVANPRQMMREVKLEIGRNLYEAEKDNLKEPEDDDRLLDIWEVKRIYTEKIQAETEDEAISTAKKHHDYENYTAAVRNNSYVSWEAKRLDAFMPEGGK